MLVEVDLFSGRPNPCWNLDEAATEEFWDLVAALPAAPALAPEPPGLGYRGFVCEDRARKCRVFHATVRVADRVLIDPTRTMERWLLARLPADLEELRPILVGEIEQGP